MDTTGAAIDACSTVIFAVDVKAYFDSYRNCMSAVCDQKTLIITNPGDS